MHPNGLFRWEDRAEMRDYVAALGFGALFAATPDGPRVAHVPVVWLDDSTLGLHLSRGNALARHLDGATALFTAFGPDGYVSPDWYGLGTDEVPTWNYVAVELEGTIRRMDREQLRAQVDALSHANEARLAPKPEWTSAKMDALRLDQLLGAIAGFRLEVQAWRGTRKLGQNKPAAAREAATDALEAQGRRALAHWMRNAGTAAS
ncbi:FMN-binding negative transcriptional regulator [Sphingomonas canadensis]|uniref:FMN-binding negative transcriptional regulator n=1 Tax=Sphingomonas canadensis TaxID=1219257 RepID=A0ABW3HAX6_9SPHN|nr:FMN-binding negative transcriptional regulator [Sphingomonas canadensis]MCW3836428.1 FMN-binding negative transcriptional regulator [Sphingomonas canadensis]